MKFYSNFKEPFQEPSVAVEIGKIGILIFLGSPRLWRLQIRTEFNGVLWGVQFLMIMVWRYR